MDYLSKYLKYKNKYLNLRKINLQYGKGVSYSWIIIDESSVYELNDDEELELETQYNNESSNVIFRGITYSLSKNNDYINENKILRREQKIPNIEPNEQTLFEILKICAEEHNVILRVAGGWVRDKILGKINDDIDIAVENMTGKIFSEHLFTYINNLGEGWKCSSLAIIEANAEKSKNLETATLNLIIPNGTKFELDFVGLRNEEYNDPNSRVPIVRPGTIQEDALRRDLTINALFYNINTSKLEDYVGGVKDIHHKLIRTPIDPLITFNDDPLRIIRALRFLCRFQFNLSSDIILAMQNRDIQNKLKIISRERIGQEIIGIFKEGSVPLLGLKEIYNNGLWNIIFGGNELKNWGEISISYLEKLQDYSKISTLATLTLPLSMDEINGLQFNGYKSKKKKDNLTIFYSDTLRLSKELLDKTAAIHKCVYSILNLPNKDPKSWTRSQIGLIIRDVGDLFNNALQVGKTLDLHLFENVKKFAIKENIEDSELVKKISGDIIIEHFPKLKGKDIINLIKFLVIWQYDNPDKTYDYVLLDKNNIIEQFDCYRTKK